MLVSQIRDMIEVRVRKHGMKLSRAQATQHQAPEKHPGCKGWACILQREKGGRQTPPSLHRYAPYLQTQPIPDCQAT